MHIIYYISVDQQIIYNLMQYDRFDSMVSDEQSEKLELFVSARELADLDILTVTDSFLIIKMIEPNKQPKQILKTKIYWNDLNPNYGETVIIDFFFQIRQRLAFQIYHEASPPVLVGKLETTVGEIFGSPSNGFKKPILNSKGAESGNIIVRFEKLQKMENKIIEMNISARNLPSITFLCFFGGTTAFFRIFRKRQKDQLMIYESEVAPLSLSPNFSAVKISERKLCRNNEQHPFQIRFYNYSSSGGHKQIGKSTIKIFELKETTVFPINSQNGGTKGTCVITQVNRTVKYQFGDFISSNLQLALITCIDFTASNGSQRVATSLHYTTQNSMSQYQIALLEVSNILLDYDYDKLVPVYGFGAKCRMLNFNTQGLVHHCFPLNGNQNDANVFQVQGIMQAYRSALPNLQFGGPTKFSTLLGQAMNECKQFQSDHSQYMVLFILTDGEIHDRQQVINQLIACGRLPISIIIVGVGNGNFSLMHELDDDDCQMRDSFGNKTIRDLVQFVEFNQFHNNGVQLAREVLQELPRQVQEYFQLMKLSPLDIHNSMNNTEIQRNAQQYHSQNPNRANNTNPYKMN